MYGVNILVFFFFLTCSCPVFQAPFIEEMVSSPMHCLASFVEHCLTIAVWNYVWAFCLVPLIYISVFVLMPYCFDDCSFVV